MGDPILYGYLPISPYISIVYFRIFSLVEFLYLYMYMPACNCSVCLYGMPVVCVGRMVRRPTCGTTTCRKRCNGTSNGGMITPGLGKSLAVDHGFFLCARKSNDCVTRIVSTTLATGIDIKCFPNWQYLSGSELLYMKIQFDLSIYNCIYYLGSIFSLLGNRQSGSR